MQIAYVYHKIVVQCSYLSSNNKLYSRFRYIHIIFLISCHVIMQYQFICTSQIYKFQHPIFQSFLLVDLEFNISVRLHGTK